MKKASLLFVFALVLALLPAVPARAAEPVFSDVPPDAWYYDGVQYAYEHGYMNGTDRASFSPGRATTRAMVVTILHRVEGAPSVPVDHGFADVKSGDYYNKAVMWASFHGIVNGYSAERFGPNDPITREQMAAILYRYAVMKGYDVSAETADLSAYEDVGRVSAYAREAMRWANASGLIRGLTETTLAPAGTTIRAQAAVILSRFCQKYVEAAEPAPAEDSETGGVSGDGQAVPDPGNGPDPHAGTDAPAEPEPEQPQPEDSAGVDKNAENLFLLTAAPGAGDTVEVTLTLTGQVCLCGFDLRLLYDRDAFQLQSLDTGFDLQLFSARSDETGSIAFNYSAAQNIRKEKTLLKAVFARVPGGDAQAVFSLAPVEIIMTDEDYEVVNATYTLTRCTAPSTGGTP